MKAIILAGGLGTRLGSITQGKPKPLVDVAGRPFLSYIFDYLIEQDIKEIVLAVSYHWEMIYDYFGKTYKNLSLSYSVEEHPLGTGGAIVKALQNFDFPDEIFILNGDTFFDVNLGEMKDFHLSFQSDLSLALCYQQNASRFGKVVLNSASQIEEFLEKNSDDPAWINGGIYLINKNLLSTISKETVFSLEKHLFPDLLTTHRVMGFKSPAYFIDIGIPEDHQKATQKFSKSHLGQQGI